MWPVCVHGVATAGQLAITPSASGSFHRIHAARPTLSVREMCYWRPAKMACDDPMVTPHRTTD